MKGNTTRNSSSVKTLEKVLRTKVNEGDSVEISGIKFEVRSVSQEQAEVILWDVARKAEYRMEYIPNSESDKDTASESDDSDDEPKPKKQSKKNTTELSLVLRQDEPKKGYRKISVSDAKESKLCAEINIRHFENLDAILDWFGGDKDAVVKAVNSDYSVKIAQAIRAIFRNDKSMDAKRTEIEKTCLSFGCKEDTTKRAMVMNLFKAGVAKNIIIASAEITESLFTKWTGDK